jgi:hypothetical protein
MLNHLPYDLYKLDSYSLTYHALARYKQLLHSDDLSISEIEDIEDRIIPILETFLIAHESN